MTTQQIVEDFKKLPGSEKILLVEELWDSIQPESDSLPVPPWHVREVQRRYEEYAAGNAELYDWEDVHKELRKKLS